MRIALFAVNGTISNYMGSGALGALVLVVVGGSDWLLWFCKITNLGRCANPQWVYLLSV